MTHWNVLPVVTLAEILRSLTSIGGMLAICSHSHLHCRTTRIKSRKRQPMHVQVTCVMESSATGFGIPHGMRQRRARANGGYTAEIQLPHCCMCDRRQIYSFGLESVGATCCQNCVWRPSHIRKLRELVVPAERRRGPSPRSRRHFVVSCPTSVCLSVDHRAMHAARITLLP